MEDLTNISEDVKHCLVDHPATRNSDNLLFWTLAHDALAKKGIDIDRISFTDVILSLNRYGIPKFETVVRLRRKIQSDFPELKGCKEITEGRSDKEQEFIEFANE